jgi:hypothetical protein
LLTKSIVVSLNFRSMAKPCIKTSNVLLRTQTSLFQPTNVMIWENHNKLIPQTVLSLSVQHFLVGLLLFKDSPEFTLKNSSSTSPSSCKSFGVITTSTQLQKNSRVNHQPATELSFLVASSNSS